MAQIKTYGLDDLITGLEYILMSNDGQKITGNILVNDLKDWILTLASAVDGNYEHIQATPATVWNIPHNLNKKPNIEFRNNAGEIMWISYVHLDLNNARATFSSTEVGSAICN